MVSEASSSSSTSSDGGRDEVTTVLGAADFFEEVAALFLVDGAGMFVLPEAPSGVDCFGVGVIVLPKAFAETLGCLWPEDFPRSWSGSNSMRVLIHLWVIRLSSFTRARTSLASSGKSRAMLIRSSCSAVTEVRMKESAQDPERQH